MMGGSAGRPAGILRSKDGEGEVRKAILAVLLVAFVVGGTLAVWARRSEVTKSLALYECDYEYVGSKMVRTTAMSLPDGNLVTRGWGNDSVQRVLLVVLRVQRQPGRRFEIDNTELALVCHDEEYDRKLQCHGLLLTADKPDLDEAVIVVGPQEPNGHFGVHWDKDRSDTFYLTAAMECYNNVDDWELWVAEPSQVSISLGR